jgi:pimeloyl-ACP methyl ester carboxylesterase
MSTYTDISYTSEDGLRLHARDYAAGADGPARLPVICIHGLTRNASDFDELAPRIAGLSRRVLAPDMRGRGASDRDHNPDNYKPAVYAGDVALLMQQQGIERAVFIGTSMGGLITMTLALDHLDRIAGAVLNDIGPVIAETGLARIAGYAGRCKTLSSWDQAAAYVRDVNQAAFPAYGEDEWASWARRAFDQDADGRLLPRYDPAIANTLQKGKLKISSPELRKGFRRLVHARPALLVRGALSDLLEPTQAAWMRKNAPALDYVEVPNVGHAPMLTEPAAWDAIRAFLARVP